MSADDMRADILVREAREWLSEGQAGAVGAEFITALADALEAAVAERDAALAVIDEARALHAPPVRPKIFCTCGKVICDTQRALAKATK